MSHPINSILAELAKEQLEEQGRVVTGEWDGEPISREKTFEERNKWEVRATEDRLWHSNNSPMSQIGGRAGNFNNPLDNDPRLAGIN